jgi:zinc transporter ZupT
LCSRLIVPGLATGLGGVAVLIFRRPNVLTLDTLLGFTAGVMLAATAFSLLVPALDHGALRAAWPTSLRWPSQEDRSRATWLAGSLLR